MASSSYKIDEQRNTETGSFRRNIVWLLTGLCTMGALIGLVVDFPGFVRIVTGVKDEPVTVKADILKDGLNELAAQEGKVKEN